MMSDCTMTTSGHSDGFKAILLGAGLLIVAGLFLPFGLDRQANLDAENARISAEAESVTGRILSSDMAYRFPLSDSDCYWKVKVKFAYQVNGSQYSVDQQWRFYSRLTLSGLGQKERGKTAAKTRAAQYAKDKAVTVYYHPSDPRGAWLGPKPPAGSLLMLPVFIFGIWGAIILAFGVYFEVSDPK